MFVGDSSANLYALTQAGATAATALSVGTNINGGIRDGVIIDSTNAVGFAVVACNNNTVGEVNAVDAALIKFKFTSSTLTSVAVAELDTTANQICTVPGFPQSHPPPDRR